MRFEWDSRKATRNSRAHGVSFEEAATMFADPLSLTIVDPDHSTLEERFIVLGLSYRQRLLVVVHSGSADAIRIVSARLATNHEREAYEEGTT